MVQYTVSSVATLREQHGYGDSESALRNHECDTLSRAVTRWKSRGAAGIGRPTYHARSRGFNGSSDEKLLKVTRTSQLRDTIGFAPPREHKSIIGNRFFSVADHAFFRRSRNSVGR